ncbi:MAG: hypothetical protein PHN56_06320 [Candidatus Nanoarchaeia archaeon]|nr:hypothetical protein [Candidatus Nanoarchaeia archaeon]
MNFVDYFKKSKNYFIALIFITVLQLLAKLFAIYPNLSFDYIGIIKILIVSYAGYKLKLGFKKSAILGLLLFLSISWYIIFALPGIIFISGTLMIMINIFIVAVINILIYIFAAMLGNMLAKINIKKKR